MQQITLWDLVGNHERDINKLSITETVDIINGECGLNLKFDKFFEDYRQKLKHGWVISVEYDNYFTDEEDMVWDSKTGARFIGLDIMSQKGGLGMPADTIDECIKTINSWIERHGMK